jgi:hypothetical protein
VSILLANFLALPRVAALHTYLTSRVHLARIGDEYHKFVENSVIKLSLKASAAAGKMKRGIITSARGSFPPRAHTAWTLFFHRIRDERLDELLRSDPRYKKLLKGTAPHPPESIVIGASSDLKRIFVIIFLLQVYLGTFLIFALARTFLFCCSASLQLSCLDSLRFSCVAFLRIRKSVQV